MGTNYYYRYNTCNCCQRYEELHIGKSSGGWTFSFHAIDEGRTKINSWKEWREHLQLSGGRIFNEDGECISFVEFKALIEAKKNEKLNHTNYCMEHHREHALRDCFLDSEGHSFNRGWFS